MDLRGNDEESFRDKRGNNYGAPGIKIFGGNEKLMKIAKESGSAYGDVINTENVLILDFWSFGF